MTRNTAKKSANAKPAPVDGVFRPGELYTLAELRRRTGWAGDAVRAARRRGLNVVKIGNTRFVFSDVFIEFVRQQGQEETLNGRCPPC